MGACLSVCQKNGSGQGGKDASDTQKLEINGQAVPSATVQASNEGGDQGTANKAFRPDEDVKIMGSGFNVSRTWASTQFGKYLHVPRLL